MRNEEQERAERKEDSNSEGLKREARREQIRAHFKHVDFKGKHTLNVLISRRQIGHQ